MYGLIPLLTMSAASLAMFFLAYRAAKNGDIFPLAIVATFIVVGLTQADHGWTEPSEPWWLLVLAAFLAATVGKPEASDVNVAVHA
jgi:hypothetical protein